MTRFAKQTVAVLAAASTLLTGCGEDRPIWREEKLPTGKVVKVTAFHLAWGVEHDERTPEKDTFGLEYVGADSNAGDEDREREAREVFELVRPVAELWEIKTASVSRFPSLKRKGKYDFYAFQRGADGQWKTEHSARKVFAND